MNQRPFISTNLNIFDENRCVFSSGTIGGQPVMVSQEQNRKMFDTITTSISSNPSHIGNCNCAYQHQAPAMNQPPSWPCVIQGQKQGVPGGVIFNFAVPNYTCPQTCIPSAYTPPSPPSPQIIDFQKNSSHHTPQMVCVNFGKYGKEAMLFQKRCRSYCTAGFTYDKQVGTADQFSPSKTNICSCGTQLTADQKQELLHRIDETDQKQKLETCSCGSSQQDAKKCICFPKPNPNKYECAKTLVIRERTEGCCKDYDIVEQARKEADAEAYLCCDCMDRWKKLNDCKIPSCLKRQVEYTSKSNGESKKCVTFSLRAASLEISEHHKKECFCDESLRRSEQFRSSDTKGEESSRDENYCFNQHCSKKCIKDENNLEERLNKLRKKRKRIMKMNFLFSEILKESLDRINDEIQYSRRFCSCHKEIRKETSEENDSSIEGEEEDEVEDENGEEEAEDTNEHDKTQVEEISAAETVRKTLDNINDTYYSESSIRETGQGITNTNAWVAKPLDKEQHKMLDKNTDNIVNHDVVLSKPEPTKNIQQKKVGVQNVESDTETTVDEKIELSNITNKDGKIRDNKIDSGKRITEIRNSQHTDNHQTCEDEDCPTKCSIKSIETYTSSRSATRRDSKFQKDRVVTSGMSHIIENAKSDELLFTLTSAENDSKNTEYNGNRKEENVDDEKIKDNEKSNKYPTKPLSDEGYIQNFEAMQFTKKNDEKEHMHGIESEKNADRSEPQDQSDSEHNIIMPKLESNEENCCRCEFNSTKINEYEQEMNRKDEQPLFFYPCCRNKSHLFKLRCIISRAYSSSLERACNFIKSMITNSSPSTSTDLHQCDDLCYKGRLRRYCTELDRPRTICPSRFGTNTFCGRTTYDVERNEWHSCCAGPSNMKKEQNVVQITFRETAEKKMVVLRNSSRNCRYDVIYE